MPIEEQECPICHNMTHEDIPKPTVTLPCDKCGGSGRFVTEPKSGDDWAMDIIVDCTCTDGEMKREIILEQPCEFKGCPDCMGIGSGIHSRILELPDLLDPDVAYAYGTFPRWDLVINNSIPIPNGKGTLRVKATGIINKDA
jgi:hypothetical protein